jgi:hypothetical protein
MAGTSVNEAGGTMRAPLLFVVVGGLFAIPLLTLLSLSFTDACAGGSALVCRSAYAWNAVIVGPAVLWLVSIGLGVVGQRTTRAWVFASWGVFLAAVVLGLISAGYLHSLPG